MAFDLLDTPVTTTRSRYDAPSEQEADPTCYRIYHNYALVTSEIMSLPVTGNDKRRHFRVKRDLATWTIGDMTWHDIEDSGFTKGLAEPKIGAGLTG